MATKIKFLTEGKGGEVYYPVTHVRGVITEDGGRLEDLLKGIPSGGNVPAKVSDLENDLGFVTAETLAGASVNQATRAESANTAMRDSAGNIIATTYATKASIPTKVSQLNNDLGLTSNDGTITAVRVNGVEVANKGVADIGNVVRPAEIQGLAKRSEIPFKISDLENDLGLVSRDGIIDTARHAYTADNASIASSASKDSNGNTIVQTYINRGQYSADIAAINEAIANGVGTTAALLLAALSDANINENVNGASAGAIIRYVQTKVQELLNLQISGLKIHQPMTEEDFQNVGEYVPNSLYLIYE